MKLIIAEKPSVARTLAGVLDSATSASDGYLKGENYCYSWAIGHLVSLAPANSYCQDPWQLSSLPIVPDPFKLVPSQKTRSQLKVLKKLMASASLIINATDAGREGELIFRYILSLCETKAEIKRLWIASYTDKSIVAGFSNLQDQSKYDNLYMSAKARNEADWLFGINATIAITKTINNGKLYSLGRVQTPTFALVCKRYLENKNFVVQDYFVPQLLLGSDQSNFAASFVCDSYLDKNAAQHILDSVGESIVCSKSESKPKTLKPPLCFDLTSLQVASNKALGFTAEKTLSLTQALYEKHKLISYPRTDSRFLLSDQINLVEDLLQQMSLLNPKITSHLMDNVSQSRSFNDKKVGDHHAIIPVAFDKRNLSEPEKGVYNLILRQFLMAFSKDAKTLNVYYEFAASGGAFVSRETIYTHIGWKFFQGGKLPSSAMLPDVSPKDIIGVVSKDIHKAKTRPLPLHNDASLLLAMERAGSDFLGEDLPKEIKNKGIGTPATRASIIETILKRGIVQRDKKHLIPTGEGLVFFQAIKDFTIAGVCLTGQWEEGLHHIANGQMSYGDFFSSIKTELSTKVLNEITQVKSTAFIKTLPKPCPVCGKGLQERTKVIKCSVASCDFVLFKSCFSKALSAAQIIALLSGQTISVKGMVSNKTKRKFDAKVFLNPDDGFRLKLLF